MIVKNIFKHIKLVLKHKWYVFKFSIKLGIPLRGLLHDMSKFSPTEFWESVKYYNGSKSPITVSKQINGYSKAWLHHKGRNKHHLEYWVDNTAPERTPIIPYKYVAEMICDKLSASIVYNGKNWTPTSQLEYWNKEKKKVQMNIHMEEMLTEIFENLAEQGIEEFLNKENIRAAYKKHCENIQKQETIKK